MTRLTEVATHKLSVDAAFHFETLVEVFPVDDFSCPSVYICLSRFFTTALMSELKRKATDAHEKIRSHRKRCSRATKKYRGSEAAVYPGLGGQYTVRNCLDVEVLKFFCVLVPKWPCGLFIRAVLDDRLRAFRRVGAESAEG